MAIKPGEIITYRDLVNNFFDWIQNSANLINVAESDEAYNNNVPKEWRSGYTRKIETDRTGVHEDAPIQKVGANITIKTSSIIPRVSINTVKQEFNAFMRNRGLDNDSKLNTTVTTRGIINFWNNVATFCSTNIVLVSSCENTIVKKMYRSNTSWPSVPDIGDSELIVAEDVLSMLGNLEETVNRIAKMHQILYDIAAFSSSSSSCCCSCSSSSSIYIAYMNI